MAQSNRTGILIWFFALLLAVIFPPRAWAVPEPNVSAKSAIVIEASTGQVLYEKDADARRYPASTTKIMTLIVALEHGNLNDIVTASANAASTDGSSIWLSAGEQMRLEDLLYGMMLVSGNDATVAVAEHISGSVPAFAMLMTEKAHTIGAVNTNFTNSSGLPDPNHYTTARDLAMITQYGFTNPQFVQIVGTKHKDIPWAGKGYGRDLYNENKMLWMYDGANGVKTGYTDASGPTLVAAARRNGVQLIAVVLDAERMWDDAAAMLDYGFSRMHPFKMVSKGDILKTVRVTGGKSGYVALVAADDVVVPIMDDGQDKFTTEIETTSVKAPVRAGQKLGRVKVMYAGREVASTDLVARESVEKKSLFGSVWTSLWGLLQLMWRNFA